MYQVLIADDEVIECKGLEWILRREFPKLQILPSVYSGTQLIKAIEEYEPDLVITDINMPGMSGLEALDIIQMKQKKIASIILTAYSDFAFAQKAVSLGVSSYLVKPVRPELFVEAVKKICRELDGREEKQRKIEKTEQLEKEMQDLVEKEIMQALILGEPESAGAERFLQTLPVPFDGGVILTFPGIGAIADKEKERYEKLAEYLKKTGTCIQQFYRKDLVICLLPYEKLDADHYQEWLEDMLGTVFHCLDMDGSVCGISSWKENFYELSDAVRESRIALYGNEGRQLCFYEERSAVKEVEDFRELEKQFLSLVSDGEQEQWENCIREWSRRNREEQIGLEVARLYAAQMLMQGSYVILMSDLRISGAGRNYGYYWRKLTGCGTMDELEEFLLQEIRGLRAHGEAGKKIYQKYVEMSLLYMENHYQDDISLEQLAEKNSISTFYLSRLFRQEMGRTFVDILTDIRIRKAIDMLYQDDYKIQEIGGMVGYQNMGHFFKVFKKHTGMTPGEMKKYLNLM